jgi:adenylosuccinate synthase
MSLIFLTGAASGDEGKGRAIDYFATDADYVIRFQGGNNAGHTIVNEFGEFKLNLIPSGVFNPKVVNILGPGMVIDLEHLCKELKGLEDRGIDTSNIKISERATICFPFHRLEDEWEEERLGGDSFGSTKRGIAPAYGDRYMKKALQVGDVLDEERLRKRLTTVLSWKNAAYSGLYPGKPAFEVEDMVKWALTFGEQLKNRICDTTLILEKAVAEDKKILLEAQLGALRDITFGIYPYTTSSSTLAANGFTGAGIFGASIDESIGVAKAFATCVGEGPFPTEMTPEECHELREFAKEYGAATGRPRRIGHFDAFATVYCVKIQSTTSLFLTKLDSLQHEKELKICTGYKYQGKLLESFPLNNVIEKVEPVYETWPGWLTDISGVRDFNDLPIEARNYVERIEELVGVPVKWVSVGPERDALMIR